MGNKKLSIVTINRNNAEGLRMTMESVLKQTYRGIEYIIIDGASTDGSVDVIREMSASFNDGMSRDKSLNDGISLIWSSEPDMGIYNAMNKGIRKATGDYVYILNSGDALASPDVVERMMNILNDGMRKQNESLALNEPLRSMSRTDVLNDRIPILMGNIVQVYPDGKRKRERKMVERSATIPQPIDASMLTFYNGTIPQDAAFVHRELFETYGYFDETMKICADWKLYLDMIALGGVVPMYVDIDVVNFDMSGVSNTNNERRLAERRAYLEKVLQAAVLKDYDAYAVPISQYNRIRKHHLWGIVRFMERVLFKLEKWHILR